MHCGYQRHLRLAMFLRSPAAQPSVPLISTIHGQPFLIPLTNNCTGALIARVLWYVECSGSSCLVEHIIGNKYTYFQRLSITWQLINIHELRMCGDSLTEANEEPRKWFDSLRQPRGEHVINPNIARLTLLSLGLTTKHAVVANIKWPHGSCHRWKPVVNHNN